MSPAQENKMFTNKDAKARILETLAHLRRLGGGALTEETGIAYHEGKQILLPQGMSLKSGAKLLTAQAISMEEIHAFQKTFRYRPYDGAYNLQETLKEIFGLSGTGKAIHTLFGVQPPRYVSVEVDKDTEVRVPWGHIDFPLLEGVFMTGVSNDPVYGQLFEVTCQAPKKYEAEINGIWVALEERLRTSSIYKGKAIVGVGRVSKEGVTAPSFLDAYAIEPKTVAYKQTVYDRLVASVWGPMRTAAIQRQEGMKLNRKTLLHGPYGTGKSLAGGLTARVSVDNGWTFIQTKVGDEELETVLKTAELYAPACVFIEDIDSLIENDPQQLAHLLELFDGVSTKDKEVMVLMTSNHVDALPKGLSRVGRIDAAIEIGDLDRQGIERLIGSTFSPEQLADDIDFDAICEAMLGYEPAFIMGTFNLTKSNAIVRTGSGKFVLDTADFVLAAETLRNQHDTHINAADRPAVETVGKVFKDLVSDAVSGQLQNHMVDMDDGEILARS